MEINQHVIAVNLELPSYVTMTVENLSKCVKIVNQYICKPDSPVYSINSRALCEVQLYARLAKENACNVRYIKSNQTIWIALSKENSWLYSTNKEQEIIIQCKNKRDMRIKIERTGRITLVNNCKIITTDMTIRTLTSTSDTSIQAFLPKFNLTLIKETVINKPEEAIRPIKLKKIIQSPKELMDLGREIKEINKELEESNVVQFKKPTFIYPMVTSSVAIVVIVLTIAT